MKEEILAFLEWVENNRAVSLWYNNGYDEPDPVSDRGVEELVNDYLIWNAEEEE